MAREQVNIELARYRDIRTYVPKIGDIIVRHGWIRRTVWFGVVNYIDKNGSMQIIKAGLPKLLVTMSQKDMDANTIYIHPSEIGNSIAGTYSAIQQEPPSNVPVWYV